MVIWLAFIGLLQDLAYWLSCEYHHSKKLVRNALILTANRRMRPVMFAGASKEVTVGFILARPLPCQSNTGEEGSSPFSIEERDRRYSFSIKDLMLVQIAVGAKENSRV